jgi:hypothetical protein
VHHTIQTRISRGERGALSVSNTNIRTDSGGVRGDNGVSGTDTL